MITNIFKNYLAENVPRKISNIIFQIFNGIQAVLQHFDYQISISKRESNILTAQYKSSLRNLASMNGYEPRLKTASSGILLLKIASKVFTRTGYPLYIKPYSVFRNKLTKAEYIYNSDATIKIIDNNVFIPVIEGVIATDTSNVGTGEYIQRIYLPDNIADKSIIVESDSVRFKQVKSFIDNQDLNDNKQFIIKYSNNPKQPIILYIKGVQINSKIEISYILCNGSYGNLDKRSYFETESITDKIGNQVTFADDEISITNSEGFYFGSDGSDENDLRAAIGYNHGIDILFDNISYRNFLNKYSTILVQDIKVHKLSKQVNNIYLWRRCFPVKIDIIKSYQNIVHNNEYILSAEEKQNLNKIISAEEYCLSSHTLNDVRIRKYAIQLVFETYKESKTYSDLIIPQIYEQFSQFLYKRNYSFDFDIFISNICKQYNIKIDYKLFSSDGKHDSKLIIHNNGYDEFGKNYIEHDNNTYLPILKGDFEIKVIEDKNEKTYKLYKDINIGSYK